MFEIYKLGQGYWTRLMTMVGGGAVVLIGAYWLFERLAVVTAPFPKYDLVIRSLCVAAFILGCGYLAFWVSYLKPSTGDFFIATEGEMKKVSWSSLKEIVGSTKVVVFALLGMCLLLFTVNLVFMFLSSWLGVLRLDPWKMLGFAGGD